MVKGKILQALVIKRLSKRVGLFFWILFLPLYSFNVDIIEQNKDSVIDIPVYYPLDDIARSLNRHFQIKKKGIICQDDSFEDNNIDNFKGVCRQLSDFKVSSREGKIITEVKVKIDAVYRINYNMKIDLWFIHIDRDLTLERPLNFDIAVKFMTQLGMGKDLVPRVKTDWEYEWLSLPYISFGPISFRVVEETAPKVDKVIENYAQNVIDETITWEADLNPILYQVWESFAKPIQVSENFDLWNYFKMKKILSGGLKLDREKITFPFEIIFNNYTGFGSNLVNNNERLLENFLPDEFAFTNLQFTNDRFFLQTPIKLTIPDMERLIFDRVSKRDLIFGSGNLRARLTEVYLSIDRNLVIAEVYLRSVSSSNPLGNLVLRITFNPFYDVAFKKLRARYLSYEIVRSDSLVFDIVNFIQKQNFSQYLQDAIVLEFDSYVETMHHQINEKLGDYRFNDQLRFRTQVDNVEIKRMIMRGHELYFIVDLNGEIELYLSNLF